MARFIKYAKSSTSFQTILHGLEKGYKEQWAKGLSGSSISLFAAYLFKETGRNCVLITENTEDAESIHDDLDYFAGHKKARYFPSWEILPFDKKHPEDMIISLRMELLTELARDKKFAIATPVRAIMRKTISPKLMEDNILFFRKGESVSMEHLLTKLVELGFKRTGMVANIGEFSVRGGILDIYTFGCDNPYRIELWGDEIESIREFDISTQRSIQRKKWIKILPRREKDLVLAELQKDQQDQNLADFFAFLPKNTIFIVDHPQNIHRMCGAITDEVENIYEQKQETEEHTPHPEELFLYHHHIKEKLRDFQVVNVNDYGVHKEKLETLIEVVPQEPLHSNIELLKTRLDDYLNMKYNCFILCDNQGQVDRLEEILEDYRESVPILVGLIHHGFVINEAKLAIFTDHEIFGRYTRRRHKKLFKAGTTITDHSILKTGDYVVHIDHGIGVYWGIKRLKVDGRTTDCLELVYQDNDKLFIPVDQLKYVQKYSGSEGLKPTLSKLGEKRWEMQKQRTKKAIMNMAKDLIELYAARAAKRGYAFSPDQPWQKEMEASFIYEETQDQLTATQEVKTDMERAMPMDRLVCGDVGFGKTEVAVRAAFKAVLDDRQVAVLVPTTILAQQHYDTFRERMADYPVKIELLSRFRTRSQLDRTVERLSNGNADIAVGTHRLLSKDVNFKNLGLVIIDEEQRFGVAHKERLKQLRQQVDVLTMTATPIPRTLQFSLSGIRDMSLIDTAPKGRSPIQTEIIDFKDEIITDAILREIDRGGQVYFLHNRVQTIDAMAAFIQNLIPQIRVGIGHGQMGGHQLEKTMLNFLDHRYDVLVCTTIIESGVDIPNVNTIIVNRADTFGLAQLYQLRGRVGRSNRRAYAYLVVPKRKKLTSVAAKRLRAIEEFTALGSGFKIAMRDLEIRGAGNLLGSQQSGYINAVGFDLYNQLLKEAVQELKGEDTENLIDPKMKINVDAFLPDNYVPDARQKVLIYKKLSEMRKFEDTREMFSEMKDRYGKMPDEAVALLDTVGLRLLGAELNVEELTIAEGEIHMQFLKGLEPAPQSIKKMVEKIKAPFQFFSDERLGLEIKYSSKLQGYEVLQLAHKVLKSLRGRSVKEDDQDD